MRVIKEMKKFVHRLAQIFTDYSRELFQKSALICVICGLFSFLFFSCPDPLELKQLPQGHGSFTLYLDSNSRTIMPSVPDLDDFEVFELIFTTTTPGASRTVWFEKSDLSSGSLPAVILVAGTYDITLNAYKGGDKADPEDLAARGTKNGVVINAGTNTSVDIELNAIGTTDGTGTFSWNITGISTITNLTSATMTITGNGSSITIDLTVDPPTDTPLAGSEGNTKLDSGTYNIEILLIKEDEARAIWYEMLYVFDNLTSSFTKSFDDAFFHQTHYVVEFNPNGGSAVVPQTVEHGNTVTKPSTDPTRTGFIFMGWYKESTCTTPWLFATEVVTSNITLFAGWEEIIQLELITMPPVEVTLPYTFTMGQNGITNATPTRLVTFSSSFMMSKYEVTQGQWEEVMGYDDRLTAVYSSPTNYGRGANYPMYYVNWYDTLVFCNRLSIQEGLTPAYSINGSTNPNDWGSVPTSSDPTWNAVQIVADSNGYRLPTEAQWEYACRAGTTTDWSHDSSQHNDYMWHNGNAGGAAHPVGEKNPNPWGLYDMHGNVYEWVWDWYGTYPNSPETDPLGPTTGSTTERIVRGGSWRYTTSDARSAERSKNNPSMRGGENLGFRVVRPYFPPGSAGNPFIITDQASLNNIRNNLSSHFRLGASFTMSGTWTPIGTSAAPFTGSLDGGGHTLSGLNPGSGSNRGLFAFIGSGGTVKNLNLANVNISGTTNIGAIAGNVQTGGVIDGCSVSGTVASTTTTGTINLGGVAGINNGTIRNSSSTANISSPTSGNGVGAGGIAGTNDSLIENCYTTGNVRVQYNAGGITGSNNGTVRNCYSIGESRAIEYAGGIAGNNTNSGRIENCYATGNITGSTNYAGGISGNNSGTVTRIENCVALNQSITGSGTRFGRVTGNNDGTNTITNCHGLNEMTLPTGITATSLATGIHGANFTHPSAIGVWQSTLPSWNIQVSQVDTNATSPWWWDSALDRPRLWFE